MTRILLWTGALLAILWVVGPDLTSAAHRNLAYLQVLRGHVGPDTPGADDLLTLRRALARGDWMTTERMLVRTSYPDRLAALLVIHEAGRRADAGDTEGARAALAAVRADAADEPVVWYRLGEAYERAQLPEDALQAYARGAELDPASPWSEGRYRIAAIYQRQARWEALVELLAPILRTASDAQIAGTVRSLQLGGAVWQEAYLPLGEAYERLGRTAEAEATYDRMARIVTPRRDWTLNRGLVYLARIQRSSADYDTAAEMVIRALDLATAFDAPHRREYELDTAAEAERLIEQVRHAGPLSALRAAMDARVAQTPQSPAAWFLRGLVLEASCDPVGARSSYARATETVRPGAGAFLTGRPAEPAKWPCPPR
jgi:tetratricopeptide (TPR) repeat protein